MIRSLARLSALALTATPLLAAPLDTGHAQTATDLNCRGCVGGRDIGRNAVSKKKIRKNSVDAARLAPNAKPVGYAETARDAETIPLSTAAQVIVSVTLHAPARGYAFVVGEGLMRFDALANAAACNVTPSTAHTFDIGGGTSGDGADENQYMGYSGSRVYPVTPGANTFNLVCRTMNAASVGIINPKISALFVPQAY